MMHQRVARHLLFNGMNILVYQDHRIPKVSLQLWYEVGARDEKLGERGLAHLIEHMIFKGTQHLSESDINLIVHKLSGYCNAFTSHDYTGYLFDFPTQHWQEALPIMADCMRNCTFKEEFLQSELKAVIQELKMYNDDYHSTLLERMLEAIFPDHPYHYPVIGYKQDLWSLTRDALVAFYKQHYVPNIATLVVVGDVAVEDVVQQAELFFGGIEPHFSSHKNEDYHLADMSGVTIKLYRDVQQPIVMLAWVVPGARDKKDFNLDVLSWILGGGKGSRWYRSIVEEHQLATDVESFVYDLFDYGLFVVQLQPREIRDLEKIIALIEKEIQDVTTHGPREEEVIRAVKKTKMDHVSLFENNQKLAYLIGKYFLATGDENYILDYNTDDLTLLSKEIRALTASYLRPTVLHQGIVLPLPAAETREWVRLQERSDEEDQRILSRKERLAEVEDGSLVHTIEPRPVPQFHYPHAVSYTLDNGLKVFSHHQENIPKVDLVLDLKTKYIYDPDDKQGLSLFLADMLLEGTDRYTGQELMKEFDRLGMTIHSVPGQLSLSMLSGDIERGVELFTEVVTKATLPESSVEKIRSRLLMEYDLFCDDASRCALQIAREMLYKHHPYHKSMLGNRATLQAITHQDIINAYKKWITPRGARLVLVGDSGTYNIENLVKKYLGAWQGAVLDDLVYPNLEQVIRKERDKKMNRDQTVLCYAGLSVSRFDKNFDALLLFDQIFTGGILGSMSSRLFDLRERSGLFYTISGSLLAGVDKQPGMIFVKTIVSNDRLAEAERSIENLIDHAIDSVTEEELEEAKNAVINSLVDNFASNRQIAASFLFLDYFGFDKDYFDHRPAQLLAVTLDQVRASVRKFLHTDALVKVRVGRL
jgi:zinc protease